MNNEAIQQYGFLIAVCICAIAVLLPTYPAMVDLPQHVAAVASIDAMLNSEYPYAELFELKWITPYWLGYLLVWLFGQLLGFVTASKIVVAAAVVAYIFCCRAVRQYIKAPPLLDWLFLPVPFGFAYYWGFMNFLIALPIGVLTIKYYLEFLKRKLHWGWLVALLNLLFFAHLLVTFFIITICGLLAIQKPMTFWQLVQRILPLTSIAPVLVTWMMVNFAPSSSGSGPWELGLHRIYQLLPNILSLPTTWTNIAVALGLLSTPWLIGGRLAFSIARLSPFLFYCLFMLLAPNYLLGNYYTYNRFNCLGLILYLMCFDFSSPNQHQILIRIHRPLTIVVPIISCLLLLQVVLNHHFYNIESRSFGRILKEMQPEKRALSLMANRNSQFSPAPTYLHYPLWYQAQKRGLVDFNFAFWPGLNLTYKPEFRPTAGNGFEWYPHTFDWDFHHADQYDYFVLKADDEFINIVMSRYADRLVLVAKSEDWWLFENARSTTRTTE